MGKKEAGFGKTLLNISRVPMTGYRIMHEIPATDPGRTIDWGKTSKDYAMYRPGPPDSFYEKLKTFDIGLPDQKILDLGTGTGVLSRRYASPCSGKYAGTTR